MDRKAYGEFAFSASKSMAILSNALPAMKDHCSVEEYEQLMKRVANVVADIILDLLNPIYDKYPGLEAEIDSKIELEIRGQ
jgi:hypothetical protein